MAEVEVDKLESIAVVSDSKPPSVATVWSDKQNDDRENNEVVNPESLEQDSEKRVKFDSVDLDDISASEYTDDDGDDERDDDGIFKDNKQRRRILKKKKPKHAVDEDDSSSDDEKPPANANVNPVEFDEFF